MNSRAVTKWSDREKDAVRDEASLRTLVLQMDKRSSVCVCVIDLIFALGTPAATI